VRAIVGFGLAGVEMKKLAVPVKLGATVVGANWTLTVRRVPAAMVRLVLAAPTKSGREKGGLLPGPSWKAFATQSFVPVLMMSNESVA
jgi:hypothetical protein